MIAKNEIPILEFDNDSSEVIAPEHGCEKLKLPEKCLFAFLGDVVHTFAENNNAEIAKEFVTVFGNVYVYVLPYGDEDICLVQSPIGAPAATAVLDTIVNCGCKKVIAVGSCGVLSEMPENAFIVPVKALRAEGTSYHYLPASRYIELDAEPVEAIKKSLDELGLPFVTCITWTTDGFFRETKDMVQYRLEEGCSVVEMECAALAACCRRRGAKYGQVLFTADSLANVHEYDAREFGIGSHEKALLLGLDVLRNYK